MTWSPSLVTSKVSVPAGASAADSVAVVRRWSSTVSGRGVARPPSPEARCSRCRTRSARGRPATRGGEPGGCASSGVLHGRDRSSGAGSGRPVDVGWAATGRGGGRRAGRAASPRTTYAQPDHAPRATVVAGEKLKIPLSTVAVPASRGRTTSVTSNMVLSSPGSTPASWRSWTPYDRTPAATRIKQRAGPGEEPGEVDRDRAAVDAGSPARRRSRCRAQPPSSGSGRGVGGLGQVASGRRAGRGPQDQRGLQALAADREEGHDDQRPPPRRQRRRPGRGAHRRCSRAARAIQKIIQVTKAAGDDRERCRPSAPGRRNVSCATRSPRPSVDRDAQQHRERRRRATCTSAGGVGRT